MRWLAILRPQLGDDVSLAATSGVHTGADAIKALMVGADVAMMTSALLRNGPEHLRTVESELVDWLEEHEYESVDAAPWQRHARHRSRIPLPSSAATT